MIIIQIYRLTANQQYPEPLNITNPVEVRICMIHAVNKGDATAFHCKKEATASDMAIPRPSMGTQILLNIQAWSTYIKEQGSYIQGAYK